MEMTPIDRRDSYVSVGDGATPQGRELSSSDAQHVQPKTDLADIVKHEIPIDTTAETIASMLRRVHPGMDQQTAAELAKILLGRNDLAQAKAFLKDDDAERHVGQNLDVSA